MIERLHPKNLGLSIPELSTHDKKGITHNIFRIKSVNPGEIVTAENTTLRTVFGRIGENPSLLSTMPDFSQIYDSQIGEYMLPNAHERAPYETWALQAGFDSLEQALQFGTQGIDTVLTLSTGVQNLR